MNRIILLVTAVLFAFGGVSCQSNGSGSLGSATSPSPSLYRKGSSMFARVKTTAYCHKEADSLQYGIKSGVGSGLRHDIVRSAAADWSVFPVGTIFKVSGIPNAIYRIDDYGSALVGTRTIDIYRPTMAEMHSWGSRVVEIEILKWGSFSKSAEILSDRTKASHVRTMVANIKRKQQMIATSRARASRDSF